MARLSLPRPGFGPSESVDKEYTAEVDLLARQPVYLSSADSVSPARANLIITSRCIGFTVGSALAGSKVQIRQFGDLPGFTGLIPNVSMFLSALVAGEITDITPVEPGATITQVGVVRSSTVLFVDINILSRRAS